MMTIKQKQIAITALALLSVTASSLMAPIAFAGDKSSEETGTRISTIYDFTDFDEISITGVYELAVIVGKEYSIEVSGPKKEMKDVTVAIDEDTLVLGQEKKEKKKEHNSRKSVEAVITLPNLKSLEIAGVATGYIHGIESDDFALQIGGVGDLTLSGSCGKLDADIAGVGDLNTKRLKCETVNVDLAGVGEMSVYARDTIDISAAGVGSVDVYGNPENIRKSKSFLSTIKFHN